MPVVADFNIDRSDVDGWVVVSVTGGLGAVVMVLKRLRAHGGQLRLVATAPNIRKVFEVTSLDRVLAIHPTVAAAIAV